MCVSCVAGKYKIAPGPAACIDCPADTFSPAVTATASSVCTACPAHSYSPAGAPLSFRASRWVRCAANTRSGLTILAVKWHCCRVQACIHECVFTGLHVYPPMRTYLHTYMPAYLHIHIHLTAYSSTGSDGSGDCRCSAGYTGSNGATCTACVAGKYKGESGPGLCASCGAGKYSSAVAAISGTACENCVAGKYSAVHGAAGEGSCTACGEGKYSGATGSSSDGTCMLCPAGKTSPRGSDAEEDCLNLCPAGKTGLMIGDCTACAASKYKETSGPEPCSPCPVNSDSLESSAVCLCNAGYASVTGMCCRVCVCMSCLYVPVATLYV